jgi:polyadenylate-binding protein
MLPRGLSFEKNHSCCCTIASFSNAGYSSLFFIVIINYFSLLPILQIGPVASIRVCRDAVTRRSLGYAYVNFNSALDPNAAARALEELNYQPLAGRPMRIMWSFRDPSYRKSGVGNIFIKNLDASIDNKALHDTFSAFGTILSCKVALDPAGESKGYGFVHYEKEESAKLAIEKVNNMNVEGKKVYVGPFLRRAERSSDSETKFTNVFVKNLDEAVDEEGLTKMFAEFGPVASCIIMKDEAGVSKGFGFVNMEEPEHAAAAVDALNNKDINGKELFVGRAQKKAEREAMLRQKFEDLRRDRIEKYAGLNLYVKNLSDKVDDEILRSEFSQWGTITSAKVMKDPASGKSRGFGFVCYSTPEEATRSVTEMNGRMIKGKPIYVALAQRRDVRRAQLEQQYAQRMAMGPGGPRGPMGAPGGMFGGPGGPGGAPMGFYPGGPRGGPMGPGAPMMNPYMMGPGRGMGGPGRGGPRGMMMGPGGMMMPGGPGRGMGARGGPGGRGGRGGRGVDQYAGRGMGGPGPIPGRGAPVGGRGGPGGRGPGREGAAAGGAPAGEGGLTAAILAASSQEQQKQLLGEALFPQVAAFQPDLAGKITGMLLEMDNSELLLLLESPEAMTSKVEEAVEVLKQHNAIPEGAVIREKGSA